MPRNIITVPSLPNGEESGISIDITKKKRPPYRYYRKEVKVKNITSDSVTIVTNEIINKNLSRHQRKRYDYDNRDRFDLKTLSHILHYNHSSDVHDNIMSNSTELSYVNLYYGDKKVRIESNGHIMAMLLYCKNVPKTLSKPQGWECVYNKNRILLYTEGDNLLSGDVTLFNYTSLLKVFRVEVIGAEGILRGAKVNTEGVDYWRLLKGNWETMDSVHWDNYKGTY